MELRELKSFCVVARLLNMSRAAEQLGVGQPTVSTHIQKLEEELGMVLFDRVRRPIQLTLAGQSLARLATPLVEGIEALKSDTTKAEQQGPVAVAATPDIIPHTLLRIVVRFRETYPEVDLRIRSGPRPEVLQMVREGEVDLGLIPPGSDIGSEMDFQPLFRYERVLITPPGHPLMQEPLTSLGQIASHPLILLGRLTHTRAIIEEEFVRRGLSFHVDVELDSMDMIKRYVALGIGISIGPSLAIEPEDHQSLGVINLGTLLPAEWAGVITSRGKVLSTPAVNFITMMGQVFAEAEPLP